MSKFKIIKGNVEDIAPWTGCSIGVAQVNGKVYRTFMNLSDKYNLEPKELAKQMILHCLKEVKSRKK